MTLLLDELLGAIQRLVIRVLDLPIPAAGVDPDQPIVAMEIAWEGQVYEFDSVDLVEIVATLEDELESNLLDDPTVTELLGRGTLRSFAEYALATLTEERLRAFCVRFAADAGSGLRASAS